MPKNWSVLCVKSHLRMQLVCTAGKIASNFQIICSKRALDISLDDQNLGHLQADSMTCVQSAGADSRHLSRVTTHLRRKGSMKSARTELPHRRTEGSQASREMNYNTSVLGGLNICITPYMNSTAGFWSDRSTVNHGHRKRCTVRMISLMVNALCVW